MFFVKLKTEKLFREKEKMILNEKDDLKRWHETKEEWRPSTLPRATSYKHTQHTQQRHHGDGSLRRHKRCHQLSMVDIYRFHNDFHFSLHLQDHLRFSMGNFEGMFTNV